MTALPRFTLAIRRDGVYTFGLYETDDDAFEFIEHGQFDNGDLWLWCNETGGGISDTIEDWRESKREEG